MTFLNSLNPKTRENLTALIIALISFSGYMTTMAPTVSFVDTGEIAAVGSLLGIAHPTGYPLFTLLMRSFLLIPLPLEEVVRLNIFASIVTAIAAALFYKLLLEIFAAERIWKLRLKIQIKSTTINSAAMSGALILAFSSTFWSQSVVIEVYCLHLIFLILSMLFFIRSIEAEGEKIPNSFFLFAFIIGLGFANHLTMILLSPALLYLFFIRFGFKKEAFRWITVAIPFFLLGLSAYFYFPVRASEIPPQCWGYPVTIERILWHITGKQYQTWMFSGLDVAKTQLKLFFDDFPTQFYYAIIPFLLVGIVQVFRYSKRLSITLTFLFIGCLAYAINFNIHEIGPYFLLAYLTIGIFLFFGLIWLFVYVHQMKWKYATYAMWGLVIVFPLIQFVSNQKQVSETDNFYVKDFTFNVLNNVEPNALIISYQWDHLISSSYYFQFVQGVRRDVAIVDKELLRRSWYYKELERKYPWLLEHSREAIDLFLVELYKFEHNLPYDGRIIESRYVNMINDFINKSLETRPVYLGPEMEPEFAAGHQKVPEGLLLRIVPSGKVVQYKDIELFFRSSTRSNIWSEQVRTVYARMITFSAYFMKNQGEKERALAKLDKALAIKPGFQPALMLKRELIGP